MVQFTFFAVWLVVGAYLARRYFERRHGLQLRQDELGASVAVLVGASWPLTLWFEQVRNPPLCDHAGHVSRRPATAALAPARRRNPTDDLQGQFVEQFKEWVERLAEAQRVSGARQLDEEILLQAGDLPPVPASDTGLQRSYMFGFARAYCGRSLEALRTQAVVRGTGAPADFWHSVCTHVDRRLS